MGVNVFGGLVAEIRAAIEADAASLTKREFPLQLLASIRAAIDTDQELGGAEDLALAASVRRLLPRITETTAANYKQLREQLALDAPWALVPLDSQLDLLSPFGKGLHEPTHTKVLGFLMDPANPHGLGVRVLREFFKMMGRLIPGDDPFERLAGESAQGTDTLRRIRVSTESSRELPGRKARCDLWLELEDDERSLIVVIENKVDASEHGDQLGAYEEAIWARARQRRRLNFEAKLVFLTPDGRLPDQEFDRGLWLPVSYTQLAACLAHASRDAPEPGRTLLNLYNSAVLRHVLGVTAEPEGIDWTRQLPFLNELQKHGVTS